MTLVYLFCLVVGLVFVLISAVAGHFFGGGPDHDIGSGGHAETGADGSDGGGVSAFSPTIIAVFVTTFGGAGVIFSQFEPTRPVWISTPASVVCAFLFAGAVLFILRQFFQRTESSSEARVADLTGMTATTITGIPEGGVGEIAYVVGGSRYTAPARTEDGKGVPNGHAVKIARVVAGQFFVTRI